MSFPLMPNGSGPLSLSTGSVVASASSTSNTITVPAAARRGDLLVLFDCPAFSTDRVIVGTVPSGFTLLGAGPTSGSYRNGIILSAAIATSTSGGSVLTGANGDTSDAKVLVVIRGSAAINTFAAINMNSQQTTGNPTGINISGTGVNGPAVLACCGSSSASAGVMTWEGYPSPFTTPAFDTVLNPVDRIITGFSFIPSSENGYTQRIDIADYNTDNMLRGCWINLT